MLTTTITSPGAIQGILDIYAPKPPMLPGQSLLSCDLRVPAAPGVVWGDIQDLSPLARPLMRLRLPVDDGEALDPLIVELAYQVDLSASHLIEGRGTDPATPLTAGERAAYLAPAERLDFDDAGFQAWVRESGLLKEAGEIPLVFGHRVFRYLVAHATYGTGGDYDSRRPSVVCRTLNSDCGGLSMLFAATLRANGVPARTLFGRWALSQTGDYGQYHVVAEFFADGIGWIPVDVAGVVSRHLADPDQLFGHSDGRFLAFHEDTDIAPAPGLVHGWAQYLLVQWTGEGSFWPADVTEWWSVTEE